MKKTIALLSAALALLMFAGCAGSKGGGHTAGAETAPPAAETAAAPSFTALPEPTPEPTAADDPVRAEALRIAELNGLSEEDLRGEFGMFLGFAEAVEGNPAIGKYAKLVYSIFPVIADHAEYIDTEYLFSRLAFLSFTECELELGLAGQYRFEPNAIFINTEQGESDENQRPSIIFHELMHFVDFSAGTGDPRLYLLDGKQLTADEYLAMPLEDQIRAVMFYGADPVKEGCAELYTAKYFAGAVRSYFDICRFMTGLEYIYGTETLDELFFSTESDALFAGIFLDAGFTEDEYYTAAASLNWLTAPTGYKPNDYKRPEDILIELYEQKLGDGWRTDERFLYILKALNGVAWSGWEESEHAEFLGTIVFETWGQYEEFIGKVFADFPGEPELRYQPPDPLILGDRFVLAAFASWTDPGTGIKTNGVISAQYDFEAGKSVSFGTIDMDAALEEYLGGE